eukprot:352712-Chlamydomonas_euryale.AAC.13
MPTRSDRPSNGAPQPPPHARPLSHHRSLAASRRPSPARPHTVDPALVLALRRHVERRAVGPAAGRRPGRCLRRCRGHAAVDPPAAPSARRCRAMRLPRRRTAASGVTRASWVARLTGGVPVRSWGVGAFVSRTLFFARSPQRWRLGLAVRWCGTARRWTPASSEARCLGGRRRRAPRDTGEKMN